MCVCADELCQWIYLFNECVYLCVSMCECVCLQLLFMGVCDPEQVNAVYLCVLPLVLHCTVCCYICNICLSVSCMSVASFVFLWQYSIICIECVHAHYVDVCVCVCVC